MKIRKNNPKNNQNKAAIKKGMPIRLANKCTTKALNPIVYK